MTGEILAPAGDLAQATTATGNAGLAWTRYLPVWQRTNAGARREERLQPVLNSFVENYKPAKQGDAWMRARWARHQRALTALAAARGLEARFPRFKVAWRFAMGLGADHPTENGFTFETTTGMPVIPGSAVKGLCRRAAPHLPDMTAYTRDQWFGPEHITGDSSDSQGNVLFADALPEDAPGLAVDIINSHHGDYYQGKQDRPRETDGPVPVFFLTVAKGAVFQFPVLAPPGDAERVVEALTLGLGWLGIGAKTAVGYGIFDPAD